MVLLVERLTKLYSRLENHHHHHHHHQPEALSASLQAFRSDVSSWITQLFLHFKPGFEMEWIHQCFQILPIINKAFAKLVVEIDYHMSKWQARSMEEYLNYSLDLLDLFNSISSSISHLGQARLSLLHALSLVETSPASAMERMKAIEFKSMRKEIKKKENKEDEKEKSCSEKELIVLQALMELKSVGLWVCGLVLAGLCGDVKVYMEMRKSAGELSNPSLINLDSRVWGIVMEKGCVIKEIEDLNELSLGLAAAIAGGENSKDAAEEMQRNLDEFEKQLNDIEKEVDRLFSEVLAGRNELLNGIRFRKQ